MSSPSRIGTDKVEPGARLIAVLAEACEVVLAVRSDVLAGALDADCAARSDGCTRAGYCPRLCARVAREIKRGRIDGEHIA